MALVLDAHGAAGRCGQINRLAGCCGIQRMGFTEENSVVSLCAALYGGLNALIGKQGSLIRE